MLQYIVKRVLLMIPTMAGVIFGGGCNAWYTDDQDRNFTLWPWSIWRYWLSLARLDPDEFQS